MDDALLHSGSTPGAIVWEKHATIDGRVEFVQGAHLPVMKLWTIQTPDVWEILRKRGSYTATRPAMLDDSFEEPYRWMAKQLSQRIGPSPTNCPWPIWAWRQWSNCRMAKPDLRFGGHMEKGERGVRMQIEINDEKVLLSDFNLWHYVLNYWYLPKSEQDGEAFERELEKQGLSFFKTKPLAGPSHEKIARSWQRIFDLDWAAENISTPRADKSIQAVFWELRREHVQKVDAFTAR
jgi:hypothetical protein